MSFSKIVSSSYDLIDNLKVERGKITMFVCLFCCCLFCCFFVVVFFVVVVSSFLFFLNRVVLHSLVH